MMVRSFFILLVMVITCMSCAHPEKREARYDSKACPLCAQITNGPCSYCMGTGKCMHCNGEKMRTTISPNILEDTSMKPFSYKEPCPFCKNTGVCTYCTGTKKCWGCEGTGKVSSEKWDCLNQRAAAQ